MPQAAAGANNAPPSAVNLGDKAGTRFARHDWCTGVVERIEDRRSVYVKWQGGDFSKLNPGETGATTRRHHAYEM